MPGGDNANLHVHCNFMRQLAWWPAGVPPMCGHSFSWVLQVLDPLTYIWWKTGLRPRIQFNLNMICVHFIQIFLQDYWMFLICMWTQRLLNVPNMHGKGFEYMVLLCTCYLFINSFFIWRGEGLNTTVNAVIYSYLF